MVNANMQYNANMHMLIGPTGTQCHISPQCHKLLQLLLDKNGEVVTREELRSLVWGHTHVSDDAINHAVARLRTKIKDVGGDCQWHIESLPGLGYRLFVNQLSYKKPFSVLMNSIKTWWSSL